MVGMGGSAAMRKKTAKQGAVWLGEAAALVGKCQSCRFAKQGDLLGGDGLFCGQIENAKGWERTKPHYSCERFEYEPGALG